MLDITVCESRWDLCPRAGQVQYLTKYFSALVTSMHVCLLYPAAGYQGVKKVLMNGHPAIILTVAGIAAAAPSFACKSRASPKTFTVRKPRMHNTSNVRKYIG